MRWSGYAIPQHLSIVPRRLPLKARLRIGFRVWRWRFWLWVAKLPKWGERAEPEMDLIKLLIIFDLLGIGACCWLIS